MLFTKIVRINFQHKRSLLGIFENFWKLFVCLKQQNHEGYRNRINYAKQKGMLIVLVTETQLNLLDTVRTNVLVSS